MEQKTEHDNEECVFREIYMEDLVTTTPTIRTLRPHFGGWA